ncbi:hypothetical protein ACHAW6_001339, partial [Cyclotella cf. meneghiniana]
KWASVKKLHKFLGELRSMSFALPGARNILSTIQNALSNKSGTCGVHHALEDFRWMYDNTTSCPTRIAELVPLDPVAEGHHDASGSGAGGIWFPSAMLWPDYIKQRLVIEDNPNGTITNSDLELAGGLLHLEALTQAFDITERTLLSKGDNLSTTFWEQKDTFCHDFHTAQETVQAGVTSSNVAQAITAWNQWTEFTTELGLDPFLQALQDKEPVLQVFALRVRVKELAANSHPIRAQSAEAYL